MTDIASYLPAVPGKWVKRFAQVGLTAKGIVYCLLGILAFVAAFEPGNAIHGLDRKKVLSLMDEMVIGRILLGLEAMGLACYSIWKLLQAARDTEGKGTSIKGIVYRLRYAASGASYGLLALVAAELTLDIDGENGSGSLKRDITAALLQNLVGQCLVMTAAVVVALGGTYYIYQGLTEKYRKKIKEAGLKHKAKRAMIKAGKVGYVARGVVWMIAAYLFMRTAVDAKAHGITNAFRFLESSFNGSYLLGAVAVGLICYSLFLFMEARFKVNTR